MDFATTVGLVSGGIGIAGATLGLSKRAWIADRVRAYRRSPEGRATLKEVSGAVKSLNTTVAGLTEALNSEQERRTDCEKNIAQLRTDHGIYAQGMQEQVRALRELVTNAAKVEELRLTVEAGQAANDRGFADIRTLLRDRSAS
jgi:septal ring factor EnvC (AmiA/AmiB activator)